MKSKATYMKRLKEWLQSTSESPLEEMNDFLQKGWMIMKNICRFEKNHIIYLRKHYL